MLEPTHNLELPPIPAKRYFSIGEVSDLCLVKPHVLRYWEQEFEQLSPIKRSNRRYYQRQDVILVREIRALIHGQGYTIGGARQQLNPRGKSQSVVMDQALIKSMIAELRELEILLKIE